MSSLANAPKPPVPSSMTEEGQEVIESDVDSDKLPVSSLWVSYFFCTSLSSLKTQDPYAKYPLPYVIGTVEFHDDDYCGLYVLSEGLHYPLVLMFP